MYMTIEIITEQDGNPFVFYEGCFSPWHAMKFVKWPFWRGKYFFAERKARRSVGRDYYISEAVLHGVLERVGIFDQELERVLEVGAGHKDDKLKFFVGRGFDTYALDLDSTELHKRIEHPRKTTIKGWEGALIPFYVGNANGVRYYQGDIGLISDPSSALRDKRFNLVFFYGSIFSHGSNSRTVAQSRSSCDVYEWANETERERLMDKCLISLEGRLKAAQNLLDEQGQILIVSDTFSGYLDQTPELLAEARKQYLDLLPFFEVAKDVKVFGLSDHYLRENLARQGYRKLEFERLPDQKEMDVEDLGTIDAILIKY